MDCCLLAVKTVTVVTSKYNDITAINRLNFITYQYNTIQFCKCYRACWPVASPHSIQSITIFRNRTKYSKNKKIKNTKHLSKVKLCISAERHLTSWYSASELSITLRSHCSDSVVSESSTIARRYVPTGRLKHFYINMHKLRNCR